MFLPMKMIVSKTSHCFWQKPNKVNEFNPSFLYVLYPRPLIFSFLFFSLFIFTMQPQAATVVDVQSSSPGPSSPPQHRILNRVSTLFGAKKKNVTPAEFVQEQAEESQADSLYDADDAASRVDSMYSSLHSRRSGYRPSAANNIPAPLRTVQLENPIVHLPTPPTPPANDKHPSPSPEPKKIITPPSSLSSSQKKVEDVEEQFKLLLVILIIVFYSKS